MRSGNGGHIVTFSEQQLRKYGQHGLAIIDMNTLSASLWDRFTIETEPLLLMAKPAFVWKRGTANAPKIMISTENTVSAEHEKRPKTAANIPKDAVRIDSGKELAAITVSYCPKAGFCGLRLEPIYK